MLEKLARKYLERRGYMVLKRHTYESSGGWIEPSGLKMMIVRIVPGGSGGAASSYDN